MEGSSEEEKIARELREKKKSEERKREQGNQGNISWAEMVDQTPLISERMIKRCTAKEMIRNGLRDIQLPLFEDKLERAVTALTGVDENDETEEERRRRINRDKNGNEMGREVINKTLEGIKDLLLTLLYSHTPVEHRPSVFSFHRWRFLA